MRNAYIDQQTFRGRYETMLTQYSAMQTQVEELKYELMNRKSQEQKLPAAAKALNSAQDTIRELRHALTNSEEHAKHSEEYAKQATADQEQVRRLREQLAKADADTLAMTSKIKRQEEAEAESEQELTACRAQLQQASEQHIAQSKAAETLRGRVAVLEARVKDCTQLEASNAWFVRHALKMQAGRARRARLWRTLIPWAALSSRNRDLCIRSALHARHSSRRRLWRSCAGWRERTAQLYQKRRILSALAARFRRSRLLAAFRALTEAHRLHAKVFRHLQLDWRHLQLDWLRAWRSAAAMTRHARSRLQVCLRRKIAMPELRWGCRASFLLRF